MENKYQEAKNFIAYYYAGYLPYDNPEKNIKFNDKFVQCCYTLQELIDNYDALLKLYVEETKEKVIVSKALDIAIKCLFDAGEGINYKNEAEYGTEEDMKKKALEIARKELENGK